MRYSHDRFCIGRGAVNGAPENCSAYNPNFTRCGEFPRSGSAPFNASVANSLLKPDWYMVAGGVYHSYTDLVKTVQLSELGAVAEDVRNGETVEVRDGETVVAKVVPTPPMTDEEWLDEMERQGKITRGTGKLPDWFLTERPPKFDGSVLEQLLADRRKNDW